MGKLIGILMILCGCAGLLYQWMKVQRCRALLMEEWIRIFAAFEYALEKEHVPIQRFFLRYDGRRWSAFLKECCNYWKKMNIRAGRWCGAWFSKSGKRNSH